MEQNFKITQLNRHNMETQNFLIFFLILIKHIKCRILLPKEKLAQYFSTFRSSFKQSHCSKVITALSVRVTIMLCL